MSNNSETIIDCHNCGQKNRVLNLAQQPKKRPICSKCWASLVTTARNNSNVHPPPKPDKNAREPTTKKTSESKAFERNIIIILLVVLAFVWFFYRDRQSTKRRDYSPSKIVSTKYTPPLSQKKMPQLPPQQAFPYNGAVKTFTSKERIAPLKINGGSGSYYLVKLVDYYTKNPIISIFVSSGSTVKVEVPLGLYEFRYASGEKWYGYKNLFGPNTSYNKADKTFNFEITGDRITGYTITLYKVSDGNLKTSKMDASQF